MLKNYIYADDLQLIGEQHEPVVFLLRYIALTVFREYLRDFVQIFLRECVADAVPIVLLFGGREELRSVAVGKRNAAILKCQNGIITKVGENVVVLRGAAVGGTLSGA